MYHACVLCAAYWGLPDHRTQFLRVLEDGNLTGQMLVNEHRFSWEARIDADFLS